MSFWNRYDESSAYKEGFFSSFDLYGLRSSFKENASSDYNYDSWDAAAAKISTSFERVGKCLFDSMQIVKEKNYIDRSSAHERDG